MDEDQKKTNNLIVENRMREILMEIGLYSGMVSVSANACAMGEHLTKSGLKNVSDHFSSLIDSIEKLNKTAKELMS